MTLPSILPAQDADTVLLDFGMFVAEKARFYRASPGAVITALRPALSLEAGTASPQPEMVLAPTPVAAPPVAPPPVKKLPARSGAPGSPRASADTIRGRVASCHAAHPDWPGKLIARHLSLKESQVRAAASQQGLKLVPLWDYAKAEKAKRAPTPAPAPGKAKTGPAEWRAKKRKTPPPAMPPPSVAAPAVSPPSGEGPIKPAAALPAAPGTKFMLRCRATGLYLNQAVALDNAGLPLLTRDTAYRWAGSEAQMRAVRKKLPATLEMRAEVLR